MNAVISGRAGVAFLVQGDQLFSLHLEKPEELIPRRPDQYHLLIGEGTDLEFLEKVDSTAVRQRLERAVCREEALDVSLLLLDGGLPDSFRTQAAADLDECLAAPGALDSLDAVLYAAPLTETADLPGALRCAQNQEQSVLPFLRRLGAQQPAIRTVRQAWEALPDFFFDGADERRDAMTNCLRAGLFRDMARALAESGSPGSLVMQVLNVRPELDRFSKALTRWGEIVSVQCPDAGPSDLSLGTKLQVEDDDLLGQHRTVNAKRQDISVTLLGRALSELGAALHRTYLWLPGKAASVYQTLFKWPSQAAWAGEKDSVYARAYHSRLTQKLASECKFFVPLRLSPASPEATSPAELLNDILSDKRNVLDLFRREYDAPRCISIIGTAGSGKTSLLRHLTLKLLREQEGSYRAYTPILLSLGAWRDEFTYDPLSALARQSEEGGDRFWLESSLRRGKCLILLDAMDEISDSVRHSAAIWVEKQMARYPGNPFIVTSRPSRHVDMMMRSTSTVELQPFTPAQSMAFLEAWYSAHEPALADSRAIFDYMASISSYFRTSEASPRMVRTPLYLTLLAAAYSSGGSLPARPADVYAAFLNNLLGLPPEGKGHASRLTQTEKRANLRPLALHMMRKHITQITLSEAVLAIEASLEEFGVTQQSRATVFLREMESGHGLLAESETGVYRFAQRTFQEFLAAAHLREIGKEPELVSHIADSWWHETIRLYAGLGDASSLVRACLSAAEKSPETLALAQECAFEARTLDPSVLALVEHVLRWRKFASGKEK